MVRNAQPVTLNEKHSSHREGGRGQTTSFAQFQMEHILDQVGIEFLKTILVRDILWRER